ncbi:hypothetical protein E2C01_056539 [Portunus trituberculatus]|uniref:Uncharacterized protein n=1 Tax=Portunus trituberculatus TaxID=210409 RepID=A0A5B7H0T6_PORTR|nr:hypothetical protein [Portunus trituberculatus]
MIRVEDERAQRAKLLAKEQKGQKKDKRHLNKLAKRVAKEEAKLEIDEARSGGLETEAAKSAKKPKLKAQ